MYTAIKFLFCILVSLLILTQLPKDDLTIYGSGQENENKWLAILYVALGCSAWVICFVVDFWNFLRGSKK
jgi:hypothetical protein